jgi:hypothetical protein
MLPLPETNTKTLQNPPVNNYKLKSRILYLGMVLVVIVLGLSSRKFSAALPGFVAAHFGDALWAAMIYLGVRTLFIHKSSIFAALFGLLFCFIIEFSQLYQAPWINEIRHTTLGALVLGKGFLPVDLIRYAAGIAVSFLVDAGLLKKGVKP